MFGNITDLPLLRNWRDAYEHRCSIVPIRGTDIRPICGGTYGRRKKQYHIAQRDNNDIACVLYDTDVLLFHPDGEITFNSGGYASNTTHSFATGILSGAFWNGRAVFFTKKGKTTVELSTGELLTVEPNQIIKLRWSDDKSKDRRTGYGAYEFIEKPLMYSYFVNRKKLNEHRKKVSQFRTTCTAYAKLVAPEDYKRRPVGNEIAASTLLPVEQVYSLMCGNMEAQGEVIEWFLYKATRDGWMRRSAGWGDVVYYMDLDVITKLMDDVLKYLFFEEVFSKQEVDKPNTNNNARYSSGKNTYV